MPWGISIVIIAFIALLFGSIKQSSQDSSAVISPFSKTSIISVSPSPTTLPSSKASPTTIPTQFSLNEAITEILNEDKEGTYGIFIKNLSTNEVFTYNEHLIFDTASLYKLWIMGAACSLMKEGKLDPDMVLASDVQALNTAFQIASDEAELTEGIVESSVTHALEQMITVSDNYTALLLSKKIGLAYVSDFLKNQGFEESTINPATTTAYDIGVFFEKLYRGTLIDKTMSETMLSLLKHQARNTKIPKYIPPSITIAHKTGEFGNFNHDAGILYLPQKNIIIVILTKNINQDTTFETIARIAYITYLYFLHS